MMRKINEIIIHCSDTQEGCDVTAQQIRTWHTIPKAQGGPGFRDIGYHDVIRLDGTVEYGRPYADAGAHCLDHNLNSIGICYIGGRKIKDDGDWEWGDTRTPEQKEALKLQCAFHLLEWNLTPDCIHGHNEFANKACPCFNVKDWVKNEFKPWWEENKEGLCRSYACAHALNIVEDYYGLPTRSLIKLIKQYV